MVILMNKNNKLKETVETYADTREILLEDVINFGEKFLKRVGIKNYSYKLVDLNDCDFSINYFLYVDNIDDNIESISVPYDALRNQDKWIEKILVERQGNKKFEEWLDMSTELDTLKKEIPNIERKCINMKNRYFELEEKIRIFEQNRVSSK